MLLGAILCTFPFLKYPYDMYHNLILIDAFSDALKNINSINRRIWVDGTLGIGNVVNRVIIPDSPYLWHYYWAYIFDILYLSDLNIFIKAKVIHITQIYISLFCIYYFSLVITRNLFVNITIFNLHIVSFWSTLIWLTIFATFSAYYHQVWIMWYSVNYQIALPLFWYILGLTIVLIFEKRSWKIKLFIILQILLISKFILQVHAMEFLYYIMHLCILGVIFFDKVFIFIKKYFYLLPLIIGLIYYTLIIYPSDKPQILNYLECSKFSQLYEKIIHEGSILLHGYNRAYASINELMYVIGGISIFFILYILFLKYNNKKIYIHTRLLLYLYITSLFLLIPLYQFTGGLFALITKTVVVNRLYYSSSLFVLLPIVVYYFTSKYNLRIVFLNLSIILILSGTLIFSKSSNSLNNNYYKNIKSLQYSFHKGKIGFNLNNLQINQIGLLLEKYSQENTTVKKNFFYAREDIAFVIKYIYKENVHWEGRGSNPKYIHIYYNKQTKNGYNKILIEVPKNFPHYTPYL